jgi:hypothetical protein
VLRTDRRTSTRRTPGRVAEYGESERTMLTP